MDIIAEDLILELNVGLKDFQLGKHNGRDTRPIVDDNKQIDCSKRYMEYLHYLCVSNWRLNTFNFIKILVTQNVEV